MTFQIRPLAGSDIAAVVTADGGEWWLRDEMYWSKMLIEHASGDRAAVIVAAGGEITAYANLLWRSHYPGFQRASIPEINNVRVAECFRRRGIATSIIAHFEERARSAGRSAIGLGAGLYADYGAAQRLYAKLGYVPGGAGITYKNVVVDPGNVVSVDDELLLWLVKQFK